MLKHPLNWPDVVAWYVLKVKGQGFQKHCSKEHVGFRLLVCMFVLQGHAPVVTYIFLSDEICRMGSTGENKYGEFTYENLEREPYWPSEKLRISITGAGGFIASHIARRLKSEGHYIIASDWKKNEHMTEEMFCHEFHLVDLRVMDNCLKVTTGVDHVFNLAADMGGMGFIQSNHSVIMYNNTMISFNMLEAARVNGVKRFVPSNR